MKTGPVWVVIFFLVAMMAIQYLCESEWRERTGKPPIFQKK